jgi:anti-sigma regulatory factor (Ser/Thr protein kinase)
MKSREPRAYHFSVAATAIEHETLASRIRLIAMPSRNKVFISYSHRDTQWLERLRVHLRPLERLGVIERWDDSRIAVGDKWRDSIRAALSQTRVAVLLVSADFLASDFIDANELPPLLAAAESDGATIIPVILSPCRFKQNAALSQFQSLNPPSEPLSLKSQPEQDGVWVRLADEIERIICAPSSPKANEGEQRKGQDERLNLLHILSDNATWARESLEIECSLSKFQEERADLLKRKIDESLQARGFDEELQRDFDITFTELKNNAFEHGCKKETDEVTFQVEITPSFASLTVRNPPYARSFDFKRVVSRNLKKLKEDPSSERGQGLLLVTALADDVKAASSDVRHGTGVKATFFRSRVRFDAQVIGRVAIIRVETRESAENPSFERRLLREAIHYSDLDLILDFSVFVDKIAIRQRSKTRIVHGHLRVATRYRSAILRVKQARKKPKRSEIVNKYKVTETPPRGLLRDIEHRTAHRVVALFKCASGHSPNIPLPKSLVARSWKEALDRLGQSNLLQKVSSRKKQRKRSTKERS